jgi:hypothetical protein
VSPIFPDQPNELVLTESRTLRDAHAERVDVLDRVKAVHTLDATHITIEVAASYFGTEIDAIKWHVRNNRDELTSDGMKVLSGPELAIFRAEFARESDSLANISSKARSLILLPRRAVLRLAMLLRDSEIAKQIRTHLLDVEQTYHAEFSAWQDARARAAERGLGEPITWTLDEAVAVIRQRYAIHWTSTAFARLLRQAGVLKQTAAPKKPFTDLFWFTGSAWEVHPHALPVLARRANAESEELRGAQGIQTHLAIEGAFRELPEGGAA